MQHSNRLLVAKRAQVQAAGSAHPLSCLIETSSLLLIDYPQPSVGWYRCAMRRTIYSHTVTLICTWPMLYTGIIFIPNNAPSLMLICAAINGCPRARNNALHLPRTKRFAATKYGRVECKLLWPKRKDIRGRKSQPSWHKQMIWRREGNCEAK